MPRFEMCLKCRLSLPISCLTPVIASNQGKQVRGFLCDNCKKQVNVQEKK